MAVPKQPQMQRNVFVALSTPACMQGSETENRTIQCPKIIIIINYSYSPNTMSD